MQLGRDARDTRRSTNREPRIGLGLSPDTRTRPTTRPTSSTTTRSGSSCRRSRASYALTVCEIDADHASPRGCTYHRRRGLTRCVPQRSGCSPPTTGVFTARVRDSHHRGEPRAAGMSRSSRTICKTVRPVRASVDAGVACPATELSHEVDIHSSSPPPLSQEKHQSPDSGSGGAGRGQLRIVISSHGA